jgi:hypothetical protein
MKRYKVYFKHLGRMPMEVYAPNEQDARIQCEQRLRRFGIRTAIYNIERVKYTEPRLPHGRCKHINKTYVQYAKIYPNREIDFAAYLITLSIEEARNETK